MILFEGPPGVGKTSAACDLASRLGLGILAVDIPSLMHTELPARTAATLAFREAALQEAVLYLSGGGALFEEGDRSRVLRDAIQQQHQAVGGPLLMSARTASEVPALVGGLPVTRIALAMPSNQERRDQWNAAIGTALSEDQLSEVASAFRLSPDQIRDAAAVARHRASQRGATQDQVVLEDVYLGCRAVSGRGLAAVADEVAYHATWDDIVLPADSLAQLRELCSTVRCRSIVLDGWGFGKKLGAGTGTTALFAGPSGTGKTMAAGIIARELGLPLFRIDLARVVSKWIGETEKNLDRVFKAAEDSNAVLFIDEADALLGKRSEVKDSHDRYANLEVSYLLQRMEVYEGLAILATNMRQLMDDAFMRRLSFTVLFPLPEEPDRRRLWRTLWPMDMPAAAGLDLDRLARFRFAGGNIKNVLLSAAYRAAAEGSVVKMDHLLHGVRREYQKIGKQMTEAELSPP
jgi:AAA+ superfamily predicted ATPase